ncbi:PilZ domain-containing protein [Massilia dura]|uniref:PilZ domain-containing protein n=2 Tax=Pseudoduganella dura TaxID=321982 RepID=A0A6I3XFL9_9BURK|nr:PilZ domain-containing protein [Pseudoduganella dura]
MLADRGEAVTIYPAGAIEPVLACILSVHETEPEFTLLLNEGSTLPAGSCTFVTRLDSARFQFELTDDRAALPGAPARVRVAFPSHGLVLNRRATARLETPLAGNYTASFVLFGTPYELQLYDVATGGIGMRCAPRDSPGLHIGRKLQRVRLELNETVVICDLEVRLSRRFRSFLLGEQVQIGCRFVNLSPLMQVAVEKAIGKMTLGRR